MHPASSRPTEGLHVPLSELIAVYERQRQARAEAFASREGAQP